MKNSPRDIFRLLRPRQWIKNLAVFAAIIFTGELFNPDAFLNTVYGFFIFCAISSGIYVINDLFDREKDRLHPFKKFRPLAHGDVTVPVAVAIAAALIFVSLLLSFFITPAFFLIAMVYLLLQFSYSAFLKQFAVIDILALAGGYILRVYAGAVITGFHISVWLLLTTVSLSLFLAIGKRRRELTLISEQTGASIAAVRKSLSHYSERLLDVYVSIFATSTFVFYALYTFLGYTGNLSVASDLLLPQYLPEYLNRKWLMLTIIPVVYGLMRYLQDIYEKHQGESPEKVLFSDKLLLASVVIWGLLVILVIYGLGA